MGQTLAAKLIESHRVVGENEGRDEIGLRIDQTLTQDATGTLVMLELEAMGIDRVHTDLSAQYVDHNLIQQDHKNPDDHLYLHSACRRFGVWYSRPGNGVSHPLHQAHFGRPGATLLGSDSHTPAAGAIGMLAMGAGGLEVAMAMAGEPYFIKQPRIWGIKLVGELPDWVSAKDIILEMLRRHDVDGATGYILEYCGPGIDQLSVMDRHVIANMGTELGATSTVFPSDDAVRAFMRSYERQEEWRELRADDDADYDREEEIDLSKLEPLIAMPSSPGKVRPVRQVAGEPIYQAYIGSSANPGYRDFAIAAEIVRDRQVHDRVSFDINPTSRELLETLARDGRLASLLRAGARLHQAGCNGCIGMGQAPATDQISLRTVPRNFPGRSGTREDKVCLVSPETAAASALRGVITDPRDLEMDYPSVDEPQQPVVNRKMFLPPLEPDEACQVETIKGPNIAALPRFDPLEDSLELEVGLKVGDDLSTDEIMPAGARVLPYRSNIEQISRFCFEGVDRRYYDRVTALERADGHAIVGGRNYGQGSSREHAALAPRFLGLRLVIARSFARIHRRNLVNFGVLALRFGHEQDYENLEAGDRIRIDDLHDQLRAGSTIRAVNLMNDASLQLKQDYSSREIQVLIEGGLINWKRSRLHAAER